MEMEEPPSEDDSVVNNSDEDDDSEYTYVTDDEEDEIATNKSSSDKKGWFSFLRRDDEHHEADDDDDDASEDSFETEEEDDEVEDCENDNESETLPFVDHNSTASSSSEEDDILDQIDKYNPSTVQQDNNNDDKEEETEESILMAQAIQRVQQRIQSHGGNIYNALETNDQQLVDSLRGVHDESVIREVVGRAMDREEIEKKEVNKGGEEEDLFVQEVKVEVLQEEDSANDNVNLLKMEDKEITQPEFVPNNGSNGVVTADNDVKPIEGEGSDENQEHSLKEGHGESEEEDDDEEEEEGPTLEEQRSLLSLAAEHDRVDVIKELLSISQNDDVNSSLLCGFSSADEHNTSNNNNNNINPNEKINEQDATNESPNNDVFFVPPPLHAAIAHGSVNAASCLLRMGADPSIRPIVPTPYLSRNYQPSPTSTATRSRSRSSMEEDRNYKKYHEMSAWELAFGSIVILEDDDFDDSNDEEMKVEEEEEVREKRGWFGFGGGSSSHKKEEDDIIIQQQQDANGKNRIVRRRQPLNIAPNKLEGIRHAFTAEALRAIGADEVERLKQLLDSGMDSEMEVAGKSLVSWAIEMEADGCCELLRADEINADEGVSPLDSDGSSPVADSTNDVDQTQPPSTKPPALDQQLVPSIHDERLAGLSSKDILTLIQEKENLIPALTTCRDDLAEETSACQNILRDVQASGGRAGLSSRSLLDLVHSLKEKRRDLEEDVKDWQHAWEEREDEFDFFWEEVLNDEWREHFAQSGILESVAEKDALLVQSENGFSLGDLTKRFCEVDNRVNTLRSSIASLADECARYQAEVERVGMSGALSLTKSLREELKEMESQLVEAKSGEAMCRRKIEMIQEQLTNNTGDDSMKEHVPNDNNVDAEEQRYEDDVSTRAWQEKEDVSEVKQDFAKKEMLEGAAYAEAYVQRGMEREVDVLNQYEDDHSASNESSADNENYCNGDKSIDNDFVVDEDEGHNDFVVVNDTNEVPDEAVKTMSTEKEKQEETDVADDDEIVPSEMQEKKQPATDAVRIDNGQSHKIETYETENGCADHKSEDYTDLHDVSAALVRPSDSKLDELKPSHALQSGMSTALVVREPSGHSGSLSLQIWDLIRRIVGLGRTPSYRAQSESSTNIMIV